MEIKEKLILEKEALVQNLSSLRSFMDTQEFADLAGEQKVAMVRQAGHMGAYIAALDERIALL